jgi:hypothetical protein
MKKYLLMMLCLVVFSGCGANGGSAPPSSTLSIQPSAFSEGAGGNTDLTVGSESFTVQALDNNGKPLGKLPISFKITFTTDPSFPVSCNPALTASDIVTLDNGQKIYNTLANGETQADTGQYSINLKFLKGCGLSYTGSLEVSGEGIQTPVTATLTVTQ